MVITESEPFCVVFYASGILAHSSHSFALLKSTWLEVLIGFVSFFAQVSRCPMRR
jgi:hypothetical protein